MSPARRWSRAPVPHGNAIARHRVLARFLDREHPGPVACAIGMALVVDVPLNTAIADLDEGLRLLLRRELGRHGFEGVEIAFDAPAREWSGKLSAPTVDLFLY